MGPAFKSAVRGRALQPRGKVLDTVSVPDVEGRNRIAEPRQDVRLADAQPTLVLEGGLQSAVEPGPIGVPACLSQIRERLNERPHCLLHAPSSTSFVLAGTGVEPASHVGSSLPERVLSRGDEVLHFGDRRVHVLENLACMYAVFAEIGRVAAFGDQQRARTR